MARLDAICRLNMGQSPDSSSYNEIGDGLPFFQGNADFGELHPKVRIWCNAPAKIAHPGDILISVRAPIGALNIADRECCIGRGLAALTVNETLCNSGYLWYAIANKVDELNSKGTGSTFKAISKNVLGETEVFLPSLDRQQQISATLDKLTDLISLRKQQLAKLDELVKARFVEMFEKSFHELPLNRVCTFIDYRGKTPEKSDFGIPLITAKNVKENSFSIEPKEFIPKENYQNIMTRGIPEANDILFTTEAPLGNVCRIPNIYPIFCVGQRIITMHPWDQIVTSEYLEYALRGQRFQNKIWEKASGSTVKGIRSKLLEWLTIPIPPYNLQCIFSDFVRQTDKQKLTIQQSLDKLEVLKKSLMQEYFG